jgi:uncharacterized repeat protein (TIGR02543 family)
MIKKTSVILLTVLVILSLGFFGCDNGTTTAYTVTFNSDGGTPATSTEEADEGGTVTLPAPPTKEGFTFGGWYTVKNGGGTEFTASTPVTGDITVYAKWTDDSVFSSGTAVVEGNTIVHENPEITKYGDNAIINANGSVTLNGGGGFSYAFPTGLELDWKDCTTINIEYTVTITGGQAKLIVKDGVASYVDPKIAAYPQLVTEEGNLTYDIADFEKSIEGGENVTAGISFQFNADGNADGNFTVTVTKVTFTRVEATANGYTVSLEGKTAKNTDAWTKAYEGFVIPLDLPSDFPFASYTKLTVEGTCYDSQNTVIPADWGQGQIKLLRDATSSWEENSNIIKVQYNIGQQTSGISIILDSIPGGLLVQNSKVDIAYIEITLIKFHN